MVNTKAVWTIILILLLISIFTFGYYLAVNKTSKPIKDDFVTGNIIYESVKPDVISPIKVKESNLDS